MLPREYTITKNSLLDFLADLMQQAAVIAPIKNEFGDTLLLPVEDIKTIAFEHDNTLNSLKEFFLPDSESIFAFSSTKADSIIKAEDNAQETVFFGIRSCDVKAIELLDRFFKRGFEDNIYLEKRKRSTIISLACPQVFAQCFCPATKTGPCVDSGFDLQFIHVGDRYCVRIDSDKGLGLIERYREYFRDISKDQKKQLKVAISRLDSNAVKFSIDAVYENIKKKSGAMKELWQDIASRCQSCGLCLFICPTCSCFTVNDREDAYQEKRRARQWDACYFRGFTRMAAGLDSVRDNEEMITRKYRHKLLHQIDEFGMSGCVGCGRCNDICVGNVAWLDCILTIEKGA